MTRTDARERILDAAVAQVQERGVAVSLGGISLEEAIAASGVPRATGYRRWPNRTEFTHAVLLRMASADRLRSRGEQGLDALRPVLERAGADFEGEEGRRTAISEALRLATAADHRRLVDSEEWRDHLALRLTSESIDDDELRARLGATLRETRRDFVRRRAAGYARIAELLGYRLSAPLSGDEGFTVMAEAIGALMSGLILDTAAGEDPAGFRARAFGSRLESEWTTVSYALTAAVLSYLEPDPDIAWDPERARRALTG